MQQRPLGPSSIGSGGLVTAAAASGRGNDSSLTSSLANLSLGAPSGLAFEKVSINSSTQSSSQGLASSGLSGEGGLAAILRRSPTSNQDTHGSIGNGIGSLVGNGISSTLDNSASVPLVGSWDARRVGSNNGPVLAASFRDPTLMPMPLPISEEKEGEEEDEEEGDSSDEEWERRRQAGIGIARPMQPSSGTGITGGRLPMNSNGKTRGESLVEGDEGSEEGEVEGGGEEDGGGVFQVDF